MGDGGVGEVICSKIMSMNFMQDIDLSELTCCAVDMKVVRYCRMAMLAGINSKTRCSSPLPGGMCLSPILMMTRILCESWQIDCIVNLI